MGARAASDPVVILGFGTAAASAVAALRAAGYTGPITVVTDGEAEPYSPVLTSYYAGGRIRRDQCYAWGDLGIPDMIDSLLAHTRVRSLDVASHEVALEDGQRIRYSKLLVATGAHPLAPGFPHVEGYRPHVLRTLADADRLEGALKSPHCRSVLVAGASMVALKAVEACLDRGVRATLLGRSPHILRSSAHPAVATRFEGLLVQRGVALRLGTTAVGCERLDGGRECLVAFDRGQSERYDEIVLAQGVAPNLDFVESGSIEIDQGIVVDRFMRTSAPDVFAAGDVAQALDLTIGEKRIVGLWQNAVQQGRCAARAIAAELDGRTPSQPFPGSLPSNVIHVRDILFASAGSTAKREGARLELRETEDSMVALLFEGRDGTEQLVGFNVLTTAPPGGVRAALDALIGRCRAQIRRTYLDEREGG